MVDTRRSCKSHALGNEVLGRAAPRPILGSELALNSKGVPGCPVHVPARQAGVAGGQKGDSMSRRGVLAVHRVFKVHPNNGLFVRCIVCICRKQQLTHK